jgi:hypothetical protein
LEEIVRVALRTAFELELRRKLRVIVQVPWGATAEQPVLRENRLASAPLRLVPVMLRVALPVFETMTCLVEVAYRAT